MTGDLPIRLERFILQHLRSLEHLDALLAMHREPSRWWTGPSIAEATGAPVHVAEQILEDLGSANLLNVRIASSVAHQYNPGRRTWTTSSRSSWTRFATRGRESTRSSRRDRREPCATSPRRFE